MREVFSRLFGNGPIKARIGAAIESGRLPHALLIDGERGSGKYTLALEIAAALNCEHRCDTSLPLPCRSCRNCKRILNEGYVDVHVLEKSSDRATLGVDEVKELRSDMFLSATEADYKVYIIKDAEKMTTEAQNALLIVLEEPPKNVVIILLASGTDKILTTIKSRAQYVAMSRFTQDEIADYLKRRDPEIARMAAADPEGFRLVVGSADGRIGAALELLNPGERETLAEERENITRIVNLLDRGAPYAQLYSAVGALPTKRPELAAALERLMSALSDLIAVRLCEDKDLSFFLNRDDALGIAERIESGRLFRIYDIINKAHDDNSKNANITTLIASLAARIKMA